MEQGTEEWFAARLGKATASRIADIMATTKTGPGAARKNYAAELVAERLTGSPTETFSSAAMAWGKDREPQARANYTLVTGLLVEEIGFVDHPVIAMSGASPDGLIGADGLVEIKCPNTATHIETLLGGKPDGKYVKQMMWQMACTGRAWCDFVSFDPRLPDDMQLFIQRIPRDGAMIAEIEDAVRGFLREVDETVDALTQRYRSAA
jgi:putative phage-type endonuclease